LVNGFENAPSAVIVLTFVVVLGPSAVIVLTFVVVLGRADRVLEAEARKGRHRRRQIPAAAHKITIAHRLKRFLASAANVTT
jgi:energy-converting hydrogenase Eha subunit H